MGQKERTMKKCWSSICDAWVYELDGNDIAYEAGNGSESLSLTIVVLNPDQETTHTIPIERY